MQVQTMYTWYLYLNVRFLWGIFLCLCSSEELRMKAQISENNIGWILYAYFHFLSALWIMHSRQGRMVNHFLSALWIMHSRQGRMVNQCFYIICSQNLKGCHALCCIPGLNHGSKSMVEQTYTHRICHLKTLVWFMSELYLLLFGLFINRRCL